jgi:gliding motility-associated-like protein
MKYSIIFIALIIFSDYAGAQSTSCEPNMDFESGTFNYWSYFQGTCCIPFTVTTSVTPPSAATSGRETITSGTTTDPYGGFPEVAPGGSYSLKLGTDDNNRKADRARYYVHVPSTTTNYALIYRYAIVMEDPGHVASKQPRFTVNTTDSASGADVSCGNFTYVAGSLPGFSLSSVGTNVYYKSWSTATINLSGLNGHTVIVDFTRGDCDLNAHFGYGYVDMTCGLFAITINPCHYSATTTLSGPYGFQTYKWMDSSYSTVVDTGQTVTITTPSVTTTYHLILTPYSGYGCTDTLTTTVVISNLALNPRDTAVCVGKTLTLNPGVSGGITPLSYSWTPTTGLSCTTCASPTITASTSKKYYMTVADSNGCSRSDSLNVHVNSLPSVNAGIDKTICYGSSASLGARGGSTYVWSPSTGLSCTLCTSPTATPTTTSTYIVTGTDTNGCVNTDTMVVKVNSLPSVSAGNDKIICNGSSTSVTGSGAYSYSWSPSTGLSCSSCITATASPTSTSTYVVTGTDTNGCVNTDTMVVKVNPLPNVNAGRDTTICYGKSSGLTATGASSYVWSPSTGLSCSSCASPTATPASTSTYIVTGTDSNSCVKTDTVTVHINSLPHVSAGADKAICTGSSTTITASGASSYVWSPSTGLSCSSCTTATATATSTTTYIVTGTDTNGCVNADTMVLKVNPLPNVNAGADKTICYGSNTGLTASGASSYTWSPGTGLSCTSCSSTTASPGTTSTYVLTGTDSNGCVKTDTVSVNVNPLPAVSAGIDKAICYGSNTTITASGASTYVWSPSTGLSCSSCTTSTVSPGSTSTYVVTGTDTNGCVNTDTMVVKVNALPNVSAGPDKAICHGSNTTITASGAYTYVWSPSTGLSCSSCTTSTASPANTSTYFVTGTDTNGCVSMDTMILAVNPLPNVSAGPDKVICNGSNTTLTGSGATSYVWSPSTGLSCSSCTSATAAPTSTSTYILTGTDSNSCIKTDTITVKVNPLPNVNAGADKAICYGNNTTITASGASSYTWSPSTGLSCTTCTSATATPASTSTYVVTGTDPNGCVNTDTMVLKVNALPSVNAGNDKAICFGKNAGLTATGAKTYVWSPSTGLSCSSCASTTATPGSTSTYIVTGTDSNSCVNTDTVVVKVNPLPNVNAGSDATICYGANATINASGASAYTWSPSTGLSCSSCVSPTASPSSTTTYVLTGTDSNSCVKSDTVIVNVNPLPKVNAGPDKAMCFGNTITLSASGAATYVWSPSVGLSCSTCASTTDSATSTTSYVVTGTDNNGCMNTDTIVLKVNALPAVSAGPDQSICNNSSTTISASGAKTYVWSPSTGLACASCASTLATPGSPASYIVTGTDLNGCVNTDTIAISILPRPTIVAGPNSFLCQGGSITLRASGAVSYTWWPTSSVSCSTCDTVIATPNVTTKYIVSGTGANGCKDTANVLITVRPLPIIKVDGNPNLCDSTSEQLNATGAKSYAWTPPTGLSCDGCPSPIASPTSDIQYTVKGTDEFGCIDSTKFGLTVIKKQPILAWKDDTICRGQSTQLFATGGSNYSWSPSATLNNSQIADPIATPDATTRYKVIIKQGSCFVDTGFVNVFVVPVPTVALGGNMTILLGSSVQLNATVQNAISYEWSPTDGLSCTDCPNPIATPKKTTTYTVTVKGLGGCDASANVTINVKCENANVFIPNSFTPNGDGKNDRFYPSGKGISEITRLSVYDRWGELLYNVNNIPINEVKYGWDGTYKNVRLKPDVYVYIINAVCETGEQLEFKGDISIVK